MTEKDPKKILTASQLEFAKLRYEDELTNEEITKKCNISVKTGDRWFKKPEIQGEIQRLGKADSERAQRILERASVKAAKMLLSLIDESNWRSVFNQETARKAAGDILNAIKSEKQDSNGSAKTNVIQIFNSIPGVLGNDERSDSGSRSEKDKDSRSRLRVDRS